MWDAGVNSTPNSYNPKTGLSAPNSPQSRNLTNDNN
jgi:hypothetical protein